MNNSSRSLSMVVKRALALGDRKLCFSLRRISYTYHGSLDVLIFLFNHFVKSINATKVQKTHFNCSLNLFEISFPIFFFFLRQVYQRLKQVFQFRRNLGRSTGIRRKVDLEWNIHNSQGSCQSST